MDNTFEVELDKNLVKNSKLISEFSQWLKNKKLTKTTIDKHLLNMDFFANEYLTFSKITPIEEGISKIDDFLGSWFIKKVLWSNQASIKSYAATFKKFYSYLLEKKIITKTSFSEMNMLIKLNLEKWLKTYENYSNSNYKNISDI